MQITKGQARLLAPNLNMSLPPQPLYLTLQDPTLLESPALATKRDSGLTLPHSGFSGAEGWGLPRPQGKSARVVRQTIRSPDAGEGSTRGHAPIGSRRPEVRTSDGSALPARVRLPGTLR